jgi:hypothetical protein
MGEAIPPLNCFGITVSMFPSNRDVSKIDVNIQLSPNQGLNEPSHIRVKSNAPYYKKEGSSKLEIPLNNRQFEYQNVSSKIKMELNHNENTLLAPKKRKRKEKREHSEISGHGSILSIKIASLFSSLDSYKTMFRPCLVWLHFAKETFFCFSSIGGVEAILVNLLSKQFYI